MHEKGSSNLGYEKDILKLSDMKSVINDEISTINNDPIFENVYLQSR
jgi:hypothetical protein